MAAGGRRPADAASAVVQACQPGRGPRLVFSALDASAAAEVEPAFAEAGHVVVSNARSFRMEPDVPLLIPEINPEHLTLVARQRRERGWTGAIVTNPNCVDGRRGDGARDRFATFGIRSVIVTTMQAVSGAGLSGRAVARHPGQRHPEDFRRGRKDRERDAEDPRLDDGQCRRRRIR